MLLCLRRCRQQLISILLILFLVLVQGHNRYSNGTDTAMDDSASHPGHAMTSYSYCDSRFKKNILNLLIVPKILTNYLVTFLIFCISLSGGITQSSSSSYWFWLCPNQPKSQKKCLMQHRDTGTFLSETFFLLFLVGTCNNWTFVILLVLSTNFPYKQFQDVRTYVHSAIKSCTNNSGQVKNFWAS